jgi:hypothetical protein
VALAKKLCNKIIAFKNQLKFAIDFSGRLAGTKRGIELGASKSKKLF